MTEPKLSSLIQTQDLTSPQMTLSYELFERMKIKLIEQKVEVDKIKEDLCLKMSEASNLLLNMFLLDILKFDASASIEDKLIKVANTLNQNPNCPYQYTINEINISKKMQSPLLSDGLNFSDKPLISFSVSLKDN